MSCWNCLRSRSIGSLQLFLACTLMFASSQVFAQPGDPGFEDGPDPINDVSAQIGLNPQVQGSPGYVFHPGQELLLGATAELRGDYRSNDEL